jgi:hypothetical protein
MQFIFSIIARCPKHRRDVQFQSAMAHSDLRCIHCRRRLVDVLVSSRLVAREN